MQRLSMFALTAIAVLALSGAGFTKKHAAPPPTPAKSAFVNVYWWYSAFDGSYNDYQTLANEISEMEIFCDCAVSTSQNGGGTLLEKGFWPNNNPGFPPMIYLYGFF